MRKTLVILLNWASVGYLLPLLLLTLCYRVVGDRWVLLAIPMAFLPVLFWGLPLVAVYAAIRGSRWLLAGVVLASVIWSVYFAGLFNAPRAAAPSATTLRILSYNTLGSTAAPDAVAAQVAATQPDVLAIQELSVALASGLQARIGQQYPYQLLNPSGIPGMGIFSKLPMRQTPFTTATAWVGEPFTVTLTLPNGQDVALMNAHPMVTAPYTFSPQRFIEIVDGTYAMRKANMHEIVSWWQAQSQPQVMVCDCNMTDWQDVYRVLQQAGLQDAWRKVGFGMGESFPYTNSAFFLPVPLLRLDYVFYDPADWQAVSIEKRPWDGVSDHAAMFAVLALK